MYKVVFLGEGRVGKSSMLKQIMKGKFDMEEDTTTQASHFQKEVTVGKEKIVLDLWDTAGQEQYHALGPVYYRDADAAILVFDMTLPDTFSMVKSWIQEMNVACEKDVVYIIAGNKKDLVESYDQTEAEDLARLINGQYISTSAKNGENLEKMLQYIVRELLSRRNPSYMYTAVDSIQPVVHLGEEKKKCCC